jgi:hypothetical protein
VVADHLLGERPHVRRLQLRLRKLRDLDFIVADGEDQRGDLLIGRRRLAALLRKMGPWLPRLSRKRWLTRLNLLPGGSRWVQPRRLRLRLPRLQLGLAWLRLGLLGQGDPAE